MKILNIRWKALDEIYKIYTLVHRSDLNIQQNFVEFFGGCKLRNAKKFDFSNFFVVFADFHEVCSDFLGFSRIFSDFLEKLCNNYYSKFLDFNLILS